MATVEPTESDDVDRLEEAARERWEDGWTIQTLRFADGTSRSFAYHTVGRADDGRIERERLRIGVDGDNLSRTRTGRVGEYGSAGPR